MRTYTSVLTGLVLTGFLVALPSPARAQDPSNACRNLPTHAQLKEALIAAQGVANGGFGLEMWATVVDRDGVVCAVAFTGGNRGDQWPGSRVISAQKANTANAFSLPGLALSTANLYTATQPGGSLFGLQASNPVDVGVAYRRQCRELRPPQRSDGRREDRRGQRLRRWPRPVRAGRAADRRGWCQRRLVLRRPQHRVAGARPAGPRQRARWRERRCRPSRQHRLRHHAAGRPDAWREHQGVGPPGVQPGGYGHRAHAACGRVVIRAGERSRTGCSPVRIGA